jgi:hypothetical protein
VVNVDLIALSGRGIINSLGHKYRCCKEAHEGGDAGEWGKQHENAPFPDFDDNAGMVTK